VLTPSAALRRISAFMVNRSTRRAHPVTKGGPRFRRELALKLKALREARGADMTPQKVAEVLGCHTSKVYRFENPSPTKGSVIKIADLKILQRVYRIDEPTMTVLTNLVNTLNRRGRWDGFRGRVPGWFREFLKLERDASEIREHSDNLMPGLLQCEAYIRGVYEAVRPPLASAEIDDHVQARLERQQLLRGEDGPTFRAIIGQAALSKVVGGERSAEVTSLQLRHLIEIAALPRVDLRIVPFANGIYTGMATSFVTLRFDDDPSDDVVYLEDYTDASYLDEPAQVESYARLWDHAQAVALGREQSQAFLEELAKGHVSGT